MKLPLYAIRKHEGLFHERGFKCIRTAKSWYVLDYNEFNDPDYGSRRLSLLAELLPYKLYPIDKVVITVEQLVTQKKYREFYTDEGKLLKWSKKKYFSIEDHYIRSSWITDSGKFVIDVKDAGIFEVPKYNMEPVAKIVTVGKETLLYGMSEEKGQSPRRVKL